MELFQARYFLSLCETLNFTRAAEQCNVTQPSLTRAIQALEAEFGGPLLHRERNHTHLTELGRMVRPYLEQACAQTEAAKARAKAFASLEDTDFTLGLMCTIGPRMLINLVSNFQSENPGLEIYIKDANAESLIELLDQGEIDVAIMSFAGETPDRYHAMPLYEERFVIAFAPGHKFEALDTVRARDLDGHRYLSRINCEFGDYMLDIYDRKNVELTRPYRSERDDWILSMAAAGLGFSFIPEFCVTLPGVLTRPLVDPKVVRTVCLVTVRGRPHSPAVGAFVRTAMKEKWQAPLID
jgi:LysR family hydrogen peroxide-inducible transcriptional activator